MTQAPAHQSRACLLIAQSSNPEDPAIRVRLSFFWPEPLDVADNRNDWNNILEYPKLR